MEYLNTALDIQNLNLDLEWPWNSSLNGAIDPTFSPFLTPNKPQKYPATAVWPWLTHDDFTTTPCDQIAQFILAISSSMISSTRPLGIGVVVPTEPPCSWKKHPVETRIGEVKSCGHQNIEAEQIPIIPKSEL